MSDKDNDSHILSDWKRPDGPLNVWRQLEANEKLDGGATKCVRYSIQDIPEDRYEEVAEHMLNSFVVDEATCASLKLKECKDAVEDFRHLWQYLLKQGLSVGAFKLDEDDSLLELIGVNVLFIVTDKLNKDLENITTKFKCKKTRKLFEFMQNATDKVDIYKLYGVDKFLSALGLSVSPAFRGQKIGVRLLEARKDIGRKYGITVSETIFTGPQSQKQAERAGFEEQYSQKYNEVFDGDGKPLFPNIKSEKMKVMTLKLC